MTVETNPIDEQANFELDIGSSPIQRGERVVEKNMRSSKEPMCTTHSVVREPCTVLVILPTPHTRSRTILDRTTAIGPICDYLYHSALDDGK